MRKLRWAVVPFELWIEQQVYLLSYFLQIHNLGSNADWRERLAAVSASDNRAYRYTPTRRTMYPKTLALQYGEVGYGVSVYRPRYGLRHPARGRIRDDRTHAPRDEGGAYFE